MSQFNQGELENGENLTNDCACLVCLFVFVSIIFSDKARKKNDVIIKPYDVCKIGKSTVQKYRNKTENVSLG